MSNASSNTTPLDTMNNLRILVSGAGVAGLTTAHFLAKAGAKVTVIERASALRAAGQGIDVNGPGRGVLRHLKIEEIVKANTTKEEGTRIVDNHNRSYADFGVGEDGKGMSPTNELEISRGRLVDILHDKTKEQPNVDHIFGDYIKSISQEKEAGKVTVGFAESSALQDYDLVIAADGFRSRTRRLAWGDEVSKTAVHHLHHFTAWFTMPWIPADSQWSRACFIPGRRWMWLRPLGGDKLTSAYVSLTTTGKPAVEEAIAAAKTPLEQKAFLRKYFEDAGWETERVLKAMDASEDFYLQEFVQLRLNTWSKGLVAIVGDAAYSPSPMSGGGTTVAFVGAYVLAGEIARRPGDLKAALAAYETTLRPYITDVQKLLPGLPWIATPETAWGVAVLRRLAGIIAWFTKTRLAIWLAGEPSEVENGFALPEYKELMG